MLDERLTLDRNLDGDGPDRVTDFDHDALNRLTQRIVDPGGLNLVTEYEYAITNGACCW